MNYQQIKSRLEKYDDYKFIGSISESEIVKAEKELGVKFPLDYLEYLKELGGGYVSAEVFIGLEHPNYPNLIFITNKLREKSTHTIFPSNLIPLRGDGFGNYDCIDMNLSGKKSVVIEWVHDSGDINKNRVLAEGYWEWFDTILDIVDEVDE